MQPTSKKVSGENFVNSVIHRRDRQSLLVLVGCLLVLMGCYWWYRTIHHKDLIVIDRAEPLSAEFLVDVNRADWPELIQLPGLGETLSRRILTDRQENGPYHDLDDLVRVNGIGGKTLERIRPYLIPIPKDSDWAASESLQDLQVQ